jgi:hypothetical protein
LKIGEALETDPVLTRCKAVVLNIWPIEFCELSPATGAVIVIPIIARLSPAATLERQTPQMLGIFRPPVIHSLPPSITEKRPIRFPGSAAVFRQAPRRSVRQSSKRK